MPKRTISIRPSEADAAPGDTWAAAIAAEQNRLGDRAAADDREAEPARDQVDDRYRDQDHDDRECNLIEIVGSDLFGKLQADTAGADDADDGRRPHVGLEIIE